MITLYHGTNVIFEHIELNLCSPYKDFGQAFYLTEVEIHRGVGRLYLQASR